mmetsp:Transcript_9758/g.16197  ORF Transcript_9758/g.16197 Transcript_9758/m.16197 type:complete len:343 (+) Transcript_9758:110-1138(+)
MSESGNMYPHWLGLLKWSLSQTDSDGRPSDFSAMTKENRDFLDAVMKDIVKDEPGDLQKILIEFQELFERGVVADDSSRISDLLQDAQLIVDQIDMANVFLKFGGAAVLKNILCSEVLSESCKCSAAIICGEVSQNNPVAQVEMLKYGLLDQLAVVCALPSTSDKLCNKSLYGISCIVRGHKDGEDRFFESLSGPSLLTRILRRQDELTSKRVMFLSSALLMSNFASPSRSSSICSVVVPATFVYLDSPDIDTRETCHRLLLTVMSSAVGMTMLSPLLPNLKASLEAKITSLVGEEDVHERDIVEEILLKISRKDEVMTGVVSAGKNPSSAPTGGSPVALLH